MVAASLSSELRREQTAIADRAVQESLAVFGALNFKAIDLSAPGFVEASVSVAERYHREASRLGADMYLSMRREAGVAGAFEVYQPTLDRDAARDALTVLGPIAAKNAMSRGQRIEDAAKKVFTLVSGRVAKLALGGSRDTISGSSVMDDQAVGYARQVSSDACDFCVMLAGNTYTNAYTAMFSAGNRKRSKSPQPMGAKFHDHCRCTVVTLFRSDLPEQSKSLTRKQFAKEWVKASRQGISYEDFLNRAGIAPGFK